MIPTLVIFLIGYIPKLVPINEVNCFSQYGNCSETLKKNLENVDKKNLYNTKKEISSELRNNLMVSDYSLQYRIPYAIIVRVLEKTPIYSMTDSSNAKYMQIDKRGLVLSESNSTNLPFIISDSTLPLQGTSVGADELFALSIIRVIHPGFNVKVARIENNTLIVELDAGLKILFPVEGDKDALVGSMFLIMSKIKAGSDIMNLIGVKEIDLRYKNPILRVGSTEVN